MEESHKNWLHSDEMVFSVFLILNQAIVSWNETAEMILRMFLVVLSLLREHECLPFLDLFVEIELIEQFFTLSLLSIFTYLFLSGILLNVLALGIWKFLVFRFVLFLNLFRLILLIWVAVRVILLVLFFGLYLGLILGLALFWHFSGSFQKSMFDFNFWHQKAVFLYDKGHIIFL